MSGASVSSTGWRGRRLALVVLLLHGLALLVTWLGDVSPAADFDVTALTAVSAAFLVSRLVPLRLPQGDEVVVSVLVASVVLGTHGVVTAYGACMVAGLVDVLFGRIEGHESPVSLRALESMRLGGVMMLAGAMASLAATPFAAWRGGELVFVWAVVFGSAYAVADVFTLVARESPVARGRLSTSWAALVGSLAPSYLVQTAMAGVVLRLDPMLGPIALWTALPLAMVLQHSFGLYLRVRRAYSQTICSLARAAEMERSRDAGHSQRVADLAIRVGRALGLSGDDLRNLAHAAMLHDIGMIGLEDDQCTLEHAQRGADIVQSIPFLDGAATLIALHHSTREDVPLGAIIVSVCSRFDRLRDELGRDAAVRAVVDDEQGRRALVGRALIECVGAADRESLAARGSELAWS